MTSPADRHAWLSGDADPARRRHSRDAVVEAGMHVLRTEGLAAVTMRAVAERLGTGPASLYAYVRNKDDLHALLVDVVIGEVDVPAPDPDRWQEQLRTLMSDTLHVFLRYRGISAATFGSIPFGPEATRVSEGMLAILRAGRLPKWVCGWAVDLLTLYPTAIAYEDHYWAERATAQTSAKDAELDQIARARQHYESLAADRFPMLRAMLPEVMSGDGHARFEFGCEVLVRGIATYVDAPER